MDGACWSGGLGCGQGGCRRRRAYPAVGVLCGAAILAYAGTRLVGFPLVSDDVGARLEPLGIMSVIAEAGVVAMVGAAALQARRRTARRSQTS
jgi:hypothetical protein